MYKVITLIVQGYCINYIKGVQTYIFFIEFDIFFFVFIPNHYPRSYELGHCCMIFFFEFRNFEYKLD